MKKLVGKILDSRIVTTILILFILFLGAKFAYDKYDRMSTELRIAQQNESALNDSLRVSENRVGDLVISKQTLVASNKEDLKKLNKSLYDATKKYNGKVHELSILKGSIKSDTIIIDNTKVIEYPNGEKGIEFKFGKEYDDENSRYIEGITKFLYDSITNKFRPLPATITRDEINFNLTQGLRTTSDGKVEMFASSRYPGFGAEDLNSVIIDPKSHPALTEFTKKKKLHLSVYGGLGATLDIKNSGIVFGPQVGVGASYTIW